MVLGYVLAMGAVTWFLMLRHTAAPEQMQVGLWFAMAAILTIGLLVIVRKKTEGRWSFGREGANDKSD